MDEEKSSQRLPVSVKLASFVDALLENTELQLLSFQYKGSSRKTLYSWGAPSPYDIALRLRPGSYLSHGTAAYLHGLSDRVSHTIYVNKEQSPKPQPTGPLMQHAVDRAFSSPQRRSTYDLSLNEWHFVLLSGKQTGDLEVGTVQGPDGVPLRTTKLERTLIDIAVRPGYAGGTFEVASAYAAAAAAARVSTNVILATLRRLAYRYPYHQSIGFYMELSGFPKNVYERLRDIGLSIDFYLDYDIKDRRYSREWRLYYPASLDSFR